MNESLFTADKTDADILGQNIEDSFKIKEIRDAMGLPEPDPKSSSGENKSLNVELRNGKLFIVLPSHAHSGVYRLNINTKGHKDLLPLNLTGVDGRCSSLFLVITNCNDIQDMTDIFSPDFEWEHAASSLNLTVGMCNNLTSLKGCPKTVNQFTCMYNKKLQGFEGMPQFIDFGLKWDNNPTVTDHRGAIDIKSKTIIPVINLWVEHVILWPLLRENLMNAYKEMDKSCGIAKKIKYIFDKADIKP